MLLESSKMDHVFICSIRPIISLSYPLSNILSEADLIFQDAGKTSTNARTVQLASIATDFATAGGTAAPETMNIQNCVVS